MRREIHRIRRGRLSPIGRYRLRAASSDSEKSRLRLVANKKALWREARTRCGRIQVLRPFQPRRIQRCTESESERDQRVAAPCGNPRSLLLRRKLVLQLIRLSSWFARELRLPLFDVANRYSNGLTQIARRHSGAAWNSSPDRSLREHQRKPSLLHARDGYATRQAKCQSGRHERIPSLLR